MTERGFHPERILQVLERHGVDYVLIGGAAAVVHGSPYLTQDVDVCPAVERDNLERLAGALVELDLSCQPSGTEG